MSLQAAGLIPDVIARQWRSLSQRGLIPMQRYYFGVDLELVMHHAIETELFARELQTVARALSGELSILQQLQNCCRHFFLRAWRYNQAMFAMMDDFVHVADARRHDRTPAGERFAQHNRRSLRAQRCDYHQITGR